MDLKEQIVFAESLGTIIRNVFDLNKAGPDGKTVLKTVAAGEIRAFSTFMLSICASGNVMKNMRDGKEIGNRKKDVLSCGWNSYRAKPYLKISHNQGVLSIVTNAPQGFAPTRDPVLSIGDKTMLFSAIKSIIKDMFAKQIDLTQASIKIDRFALYLKKLCEKTTAWHIFQKNFTQIRLAKPQSYTIRKDGGNRKETRAMRPFEGYIGVREGDAVPPDAKNIGKTTDKEWRVGYANFNVPLSAPGLCVTPNMPAYAKSGKNSFLDECAEWYVKAYSGRQNTKEAYVLRASIKSRWGVDLGLVAINGAIGLRDDFLKRCVSAYTMGVGYTYHDPVVPPLVFYGPSGPLKAEDNYLQILNKSFLGWNFVEQGFSTPMVESLVKAAFVGVIDADVAMVRFCFGLAADERCDMKTLMDGTLKHIVAVPEPVRQIKLATGHEVTATPGTQTHATTETALAALELLKDSINKTDLLVEAHEKIEETSAERVESKVQMRTDKGLVVPRFKWSGHGMMRSDAHTRSTFDRLKSEFQSKSKANKPEIAWLKLAETRLRRYILPNDTSIVSRARQVGIAFSKRNLKKFCDSHEKNKAAYKLLVEYTLHRHDDVLTNHIKKKLKIPEGNLDDNAIAGLVKNFISRIESLMGQARFVADAEDYGDKLDMIDIDATTKEARAAPDSVQAQYASAKKPTTDVEMREVITAVTVPKRSRFDEDIVYDGASSSGLQSYEAVMENAADDDDKDM